MSFIYKRIQTLNIEAFVEFTPPVSFQKSIEAMFAADFLLLIQPDTDLQIPAKLFEYIYVQKPILAIAEENSATHHLIQKSGMGVFVPSKNVPAIEQAIKQFINGEVNIKPDLEYINQFNYKYYIKKFEKCLDEL